MRKSELQSAVSETILDQEVDHVTAALTENERAVIVNVADIDAAYTADEARKLADAIELETKTDKWEMCSDAFPHYLRDLADVVDGEKVAEEIEHMWKDRKININYPTTHE